MMQIMRVSSRPRDRPVVIKTTIGNARERYEAMQKGKPVPPKQNVRRLPDDVVETFLDRLAAVLAEEYRKDVGENT